MIIALYKGITESVSNAGAMLFRNVYLIFKDT